MYNKVNISPIPQPRTCYSTMTQCCILFSGLICNARLLIESILWLSQINSPAFSQSYFLCIHLLLFIFSILFLSDINECLQIGICQHNGTCVNRPGDFFCSCRPGWTGPLCDIGKITIVYYRIYCLSLFCKWMIFEPL